MRPTKRPSQKRYTRSAARKALLDLIMNDYIVRTSTHAYQLTPKGQSACREALDRTRSPWLTQ